MRYYLGKRLKINHRLWELPQSQFCADQHYNRDCLTRQNPSHTTEPTESWRESECPVLSPGTLNNIQTPSADILWVAAELGEKEICAAINSAAISNFIESKHVPSDAGVKRGPCTVEIDAQGKNMAITGGVWLRLKLQGEFFKLKVQFHPIYVRS